MIVFNPVDSLMWEKMIAALQLPTLVINSVQHTYHAITDLEQFCSHELTDHSKLMAVNIDGNRLPLDNRTIKLILHHGTVDTEKDFYIVEGTEGNFAILNPW